MTSEPAANSMVRLTVDMPYSTMKRLDAKIPWGLKSDIFRAMALHLCELMEKEGARKVLYMIAEGKFNIPGDMIEGKEL